jgi:hypothetical protein
MGTVRGINAGCPTQVPVGPEFVQKIKSGCPVLAWVWLGRGISRWL